MMYKWPKLASLSQIACTLYTFSSVMYSLPLEDNLFKKTYLTQTLFYVRTHSKHVCCFLIV